MFKDDRLGKSSGMVACHKNVTERRQQKQSVKMNFYYYKVILQSQYKIGENYVMLELISALSFWIPIFKTGSREKP